MEENCAIIIPCFNDGAHLAGIVKALERFIPPHQLIVIDDGSWLPIANSDRYVLIRHDDNKGLAEAVETGLRYALKKDAKYMVKVDSDGQMDIAMLPTYLELLRGGADVVLGGFAAEDTPRPIVNDDSLFCILVGWLTGQKISSLLAEYRGYSSQAATRIVRAKLTGWESPLGVFYCRGLRFGNVPDSVSYKLKRKFSLRGMIQIRVGLLKHAWRCGAPAWKLAMASIILTAHFVFNLSFHSAYNGGMRRQQP